MTSFIRSPLRDRRYTITREYCGSPTSRHVARFCDDWLGQSATRNGARAILRAQHEIHRGAWQVLVLNPDPYGSLHLASGCTGTDDEAEIAPLARRPVGALTIRIADNAVSGGRGHT